MATKAQLYEALLEMRDACCAAMRVVAEMDTATRLGWPAEDYQQRFVDECRLVGLQDGFGKRADAMLKQWLDKRSA